MFIIELTETKQVVNKYQLRFTDELLEEVVKDVNNYLDIEVTVDDVINYLNGTRVFDELDYEIEDAIKNTIYMEYYMNPSRFMRDELIKDELIEDKIRVIK